MIKIINLFTKPITMSCIRYHFPFFCSATYEVEIKKRLAALPRSSEEYTHCLKLKKHASKVASSLDQLVNIDPEGMGWSRSLLESKMKDALLYASRDLVSRNEPLNFQVELETAFTVFVQRHDCCSKFWLSGTQLFFHIPLSGFSIAAIVISSLAIAAGGPLALPLIGLSVGTFKLILHWYALYVEVGFMSNRQLNNIAAAIKFLYPTALIPTPEYKQESSVGIAHDKNQLLLETDELALASTESDYAL